MDQLPDYLAFQDYVKSRNFTILLDQQDNFSWAGNIFNEFEQNFYTFKEFETILLLTLYVPIFVIGLVGNILIVISAAREKVIRRAKNYFLINLAVADLAVTLLCMPMAIGTIVYRLWIYGLFVCKVVAFIQGIAVTTGIFTLTAMGVDRYIGIQHIVSRHVTTPRQALIIITFIWFVSSIFIGPQLYIRDIDTVEIPHLPKLYFCIEKWPQVSDREVYGLFLLMVVYIIPSVTLAVCYARVGKTLCHDGIERENSDSSTARLISRKRAARMLVVLVAIFIACWLPYNIVSLSLDLFNNHEQLKFLPFTLWLGHSHSALNPTMYWILNRRFRHRVRSCFKIVNPCTLLKSEHSPQYV